MYNTTMLISILIAIILTTILLRSRFLPRILGAGLVPVGFIFLFCVFAVAVITGYKKDYQFDSFPELELAQDIHDKKVKINTDRNKEVQIETGKININYQDLPLHP
jgi:hypothetical protein